MEKDNFKQRFWISVSIIAGTLILATVALYFLAGRIDGTASAIAAARDQTATDDAEFQDLANLQHDTTVAATYQAAMDKLLASQAALITFPTQIDSLSRADQVSTSFSFQGAVNPATISAPGSADFSLDASGPIANIISFLKDFESSAPILLSSLNAVNITGSASSYTLTAQGTVYFK